ncbi:C2H2 finger domain transcription factor mtfA [Penicillium chermesinum]|nr:C2H2 finger domain transcription factor mtfA [Penicillium chermesinum]
MDLASLMNGAPKPYTATYGKRPHQTPPSPPVEEQPKCSLPSISTLLEGADGAQHAAKRQRMSPVYQDRPVHLPPTPPLRPGSGSGHRVHSPSERKPDTLPHRSSISSTGSAPCAPRAAGPYASPAPSVSSYSSTEAPAPIRLNPPPLISPVTPAWQHHHYFPPSTAAPYQQNHDRYICRTCHKAFSRPSSLRIHSHSHTGEKPFRCTHAGCGKAFSVRSNMKRHERGCHSGRPAVPATPLVV